MGVVTMAEDRNHGGEQGFEKKGGYPAGQKPAKGVPPVPQGFRRPEHGSPGGRATRTKT